MRTGVDYKINTYRSRIEKGVNHGNYFYSSISSWCSNSWHRRFEENRRTLIIDPILAKVVAAQKAATTTCGV